MEITLIWNYIKLIFPTIYRIVFYINLPNINKRKVICSDFVTN